MRRGVSPPGTRAHGILTPRGHERRRRHASEAGRSGTCFSSCPSWARSGCRSTTPLEPRLGGVPYFYWYQFVWIGVGAAITAVVYFATREPERMKQRRRRRAGRLRRVSSRWSRCSASSPSRWRKADLDQLHEWGLGGRRFGTLVTWFLLGGDLYTAYTFVAVPALVFGAGALGFFALPYTVITYPFVFVVMPRMWSVSHKHGYITAADFVRGRFDSGALALAVAVTGILATMPYIALQLVGIQVVLGAMGIQGDLPLVIAFVDPRRVHVPERPACAGAHRDRQGRHHLRDGHRRRRRHPGEARRVRQGLRRRPAAEAHPRAAAVHGLRDRSPSARRWRSSSIRTR